MSRTGSRLFPAGAGVLFGERPEATVLAVWEKGTIIPGYDHNRWRRDAYGNNISFAAYGNRNSDYGWEVDHIVPVALGGTDAFSNLRPLHWRANVAR